MGDYELARQMKCVFYALRYVVCHEVGHSFGLDHHPKLNGKRHGWSEDCTMTGRLTNSTRFPMDLPLSSISVPAIATTWSSTDPRGRNPVRGGSV